MPCVNLAKRHHVHGSVYRCVSNCSRDIYTGVSCIHTDVSRWVTPRAFALASLLVLGAIPANAKERLPEPLESPGDCPIDAPVRVASVDSLRRFEGLIGHCAETMLIEAPAFRVNRPKINQRIPDLESDPANSAGEFYPPQSPLVTVASAQASRPTPVSQASAMPEYVAIVPPASAFAPAPAAASTDPEWGDAGAEVEAILTLRPQTYATSFDEMISTAARTHRVDPLLLHAVIKQESGYRQRAVSHAGARGLMQVMPATGRSLGVADPQSLFNAEVNIAAGAKLLSSLWQRFDGDLDLVLAAYNAGEGAVVKYGMKVPPYRETREYVAKVKDNYRSLASESGIAVHF